MINVAVDRGVKAFLLTNHYKPTCTKTHRRRIETGRRPPTQNPPTSGEDHAKYLIKLTLASYHLSTSSVLPLSSGVLSTTVETGSGSVIFSAITSGSLSISTGATDDTGSCCPSSPS